MKTRIWHFSDTHTFHGFLNPPEDIDIAIFSGDCSNPRDVYISEKEVKDFIYWYELLPVKHKIFVAGNHDLAIERKRIIPEDFTKAGIIYLENNSTTIEGLKIWGSPISPTFGTGWAFNKDRAKIHEVWDKIPDDTDIVVTHGPAQGVLDLSINRDNVLEYCGCKNLKKRVEQIKPLLLCNGHIHNCQNIQNAGIFYNNGTYYSNASCVTDGKFDKGITYNGNLFSIENKKVTILDY